MSIPTLDPYLTFDGGRSRRQAVARGEGLPALSAPQELSSLSKATISSGRPKR